MKTPWVLKKIVYQHKQHNNFTDLFLCHFLSTRCLRVYSSKEMTKWSSILEPQSTFDAKARVVIAGCLLLYNWLVATHLETPYPTALVEIYSVPLSRLLLVGLVLLSASWCPTVGILSALAYICLAADVVSFTTLPPELYT